MNTRRYKAILFYLSIIFTSTNTAFSQDTLKVMSYNVLNYGNTCQGSRGQMHEYLKTIINYTQPDILGLIKAASIKTSATDIYGIAPFGFQDSIKAFALNADFPGKYEIAPFTNTSYADAISLLCYNQQKLGLSSVTKLTVNITDFDLYKLYYKDTALANTHDTTFLYVLLNHTKSGDDATQRNNQIADEINALQASFYHLPNIINMGDFNTRSSTEACYQQLVNNTNAGFSFKDPPFGIDALLQYPADWGLNTQTYASYLTTSTRAAATIPNSCGTSGGGKSWYDHIFFSPWIVSGDNYISYLPNSYQTIGNDGHRVAISINDSAIYTNSSAPSVVINALFQLSNKYPISAKLIVHSNTTGNSPTDPEIRNSASIKNTQPRNEPILFANPVKESLQLTFPASFIKKHVQLVINDLTGKEISKAYIQVSMQSQTVSPTLNAGVYSLRIYRDGVLYSTHKLIKQ